VLGAAAVWAGIRAGWRESTQAAAGFLVIFAFAKCFDWWWAWMPRYLFFLLLGGLAVAVLVVLGRLRSEHRRCDMRRMGLLWAAAIVVIANAAAWGAAAMNRRGDPEATLELTELELRLPAKQAENTALTLSLVFEPRERAKHVMSARPAGSTARNSSRSASTAAGR